MTIASRILTLSVALTVALAGTAAAQPLLDLEGRATDETSAAGGRLVAADEEHLADVDAVAITEHGALGLDLNAAGSSADEAREGNLWTWLELRFSTLFEPLRNLVGLDAETEHDAHAELYVSGEGADVHIDAGGFDFDKSEAGGLDGLTWHATGEAKAAAGKD